MSSYQIFLDTLAQLEEDQTFFEAELGQELQGKHHEDLVHLGGKMCQKLRTFANQGKQFAEVLQPDFLTKIIDTMQDYQNLIMPPKVFGGFCPCLKPAREGPEYDKKFLTTLAKVISTLYLCQAAVIESKGEALNMESVHFADYASRLNTIQNTLAGISTKGNDQAREAARVDLLAALDSVNKFMRSFEPETQEFRSESNRRINTTNELLSSRTADGVPISRRILVKAQSSLQEIMNSVAAVSMKKAKESISSLEGLAKELKTARDAEITAFNGMENRMNENNLMDLLHRLREDSEVMHSDASSKLRDATKRWNNVKGQSNPRPVVEYHEEPEFRAPSIPGLPGGPPSAPDPEALLREAGKTVGKVGKTVVNLPGKAAKEGVKAMAGTMTAATSGVVDLATSGTMGVVKGVTKFKKGVKHTTEKAANTLFGMEMDGSSGKGNASAAKTGSSGNIFSLPDMGLGSSHGGSSSAGKKSSAAMFLNPLGDL